MAEAKAWGARWLNEIAEEVAGEFFEMVDGVFDELAVDGYMPGEVPVTLTQLKAMPVQEVDQLLAGMIMDPAQQAQGEKLLEQYAAWLEKQEEVPVG